MTETNVSTMWMVRAGERGAIIEEFVEKKCIALGWEVSDLSGKSQKEIRVSFQEVYPDSSMVQAGLTAGMLYKFANFSEGEWVVSYDPENRKYLVGQIDGGYEYGANLIEDWPHTRRVKWSKERINRDDLSTATQYTLGSALTVFQIEGNAADEIIALSEGKLSKPESEEAQQEERVQTEQLAYEENPAEKAMVLVEKKLLKMDPTQMEHLTAAILRAMGNRVKVKAHGHIADRGVDVLASLDGLGLGLSRIKAQVKHRPNKQMGADDIRGFLGTLRHEGDCGLFVSTGGFSKEARYEAERACSPITLVDINGLVNLIMEYYDNFDTEGKSLLPLVKIYWPKPK